MKPEKQTIWRGTHRELTYKIHFYGEGTSINDGKGQWCYYVFLPEWKIKDFAPLWLEPEVVKLTPESKGFVTYDYNGLTAADVHWHYGVTFYTKHGEVEGFRCIELGCDYSHLWDAENGFDTRLEDVLRDVEQTINELCELYPEVEKK